MGGAERVVLKIAQHYNAKIYTLEYVRDKTFKEFQDVDIELISKKLPASSIIPYRASRAMAFGYAFYNLKLKNDYDVINAHVSPSEWIRHNNKRVFWYCHTPVREVYDLYSFRMKNRSYKDKLIYATFAGAYKFIAKDVIKQIEAIATNSDNVNGRIMKYFNRSATVIHPGVEYEQFENKGDDKYFFYPSRFYPNKRQDLVMDAFARFVKKSGKENYKLILAGSISDDKEHIAYLERLKQRKMKNVEFKLNLPDEKIRELYSNCTAVMFAPINEDFGIVPLEGMSSSKPVISINDGGPREVIKDGKTGFLVNNTDEMAEKMQYVVDHGDVADSIGKAARNAVEREFSWDAFFRKFDKIVAQVAKA